MPGPGLKEYSTDEVNISFAGYPITGGYADGVFIEIEYSNPAFALTKGTDGEGTRSRSNDRSATIKIHLMQGADGNSVLSALHNLDLQTRNGAGVGAFLCEDKNGTPKHAATEAWIESPPNPTYDRTPTERVWTLKANHLESFEGSY